MTDTSVKGALSKEGWNLSDDGYAVCSSACADNKVSSTFLHEIALNQDIRKIGSQCLPNSISRGVTQEVKAPLILQIQKISNIAVPSYHQLDGNEGGVRLLKLQLTDGHTYCNALELKHTPQLNLSMPPGTKIKITSDVIARNGFLLLTPAVVKVLGGHVDHMVEKWKASKFVVTERSKVASNSGDGPPAFVPFRETIKKKHHTVNPSGEPRNSRTNAPEKPINLPKQDVKTSAKQTDKPKAHLHRTEKAFETSSRSNAPEKPTNLPKQDVKTLAKQTDKPIAHQHYTEKTYEASFRRQTDSTKPQQHHHQRKPHQRERFQDRPYHEHPPKQRAHNPQYKQSKGQSNDKSMRSQGQSLSDYLPVTFISGEEHFPALSNPTSHPQPSFTTTRDEHPPPPRPMLTWDTTTGGSIPFSAKRKA